MLEQSENTVIGRVVRGSSARTAATLMTWGNIIAIILIPTIIFWCGASMLVFALNKHHPNPRVGYYTQRAATLFYAVAGFFVVVAILIPSDNWGYYLVSWGLAALIIIPRSIMDLISIHKEDWPDLLLEGDEVLSS